MNAIFKFILLEEERYIEFHTMYGRYLRLRIPHFGRDMSLCREISELYIAGCKLVILKLIKFLKFFLAMKFFV